MDLFGIGGAELIILLFLAGVLLGPRRLARLGRDVGKLIRQIRTLTGDLTKQLNREIDLLEALEGKSGQSPNSEEHQQAQLPEAYRRFREDFPEEGKLDSLSRQQARDNRRPSREHRPAAMPIPPATGEERPKEADQREPESSKAI